jgi:hypothetical protein
LVDPQLAKPDLYVRGGICLSCHTVIPYRIAPLHGHLKVR